MKRFLTILCATVLLTAALCVTASASDFDSAAQELSAIGIFRGDSSGFALDRSPTRSEAAIMLVRLYGAEEEAKAQYAAGKITHPFTDVSETTAPYAAWLRTNGIVNGTSDTTFGSSRPCTAQNYVVFLLRALGYRDGTDFQYAQALEFAAAHGLFDTSMFSGTFLRDDLAAVTYQALGCDLKGGETYLLASLIKSGAVDAAAAKPITDKIEAYRALVKSSSDLGDALDVNLTGKVQMDMAVSGTADGEKVNETVSMPVDMSGRIQMILTGNPQMAVTMTGSAMGEKTDSSIWMKDGWMYFRTGDQRYKTDASELMDQFMGTYRQLVEAGAGQFSAVMLPFLDSITVSRSGADTVYTLKLNSALSSLMDDAMGLMSGGALSALPGEMDMDMDMDISDCVYTYTLTGAGKLKTVTAAMKMSMNIQVAEDAANTMTVQAAAGVDMQMTVNASGASVKVNFPSDLAGFPELAGGADVPAAA